MFLTYLVWDAVLLENTTQLFASMLLALAISAARIVANSVGKETLTFKGQALGWFILIMHGITIVSREALRDAVCRHAGRGPALPTVPSSRKRLLEPQGVDAMLSSAC